MYQQIQSFSPGLVVVDPYVGIQQIPRLDVAETPGELVYILEVPGAEIDSFDVEMGDGTLQIDAKVEMGLEAEGLSYLYRERPFYKRYTRMLSVPREVDHEKAAANVKNGLLMIHFPKKVTGRRLEVNRQQQVPRVGQEQLQVQRGIYQQQQALPGQHQQQVQPGGMDQQQQALGDEYQHQQQQQQQQQSFAPVQQ